MFEQIRLTTLKRMFPAKAPEKKKISKKTPSNPGFFTIFSKFLTKSSRKMGFRRTPFFLEKLVGDLLPFFGDHFLENWDWVNLL